MLPTIGEFPGTNNLNSLLNQQQISLLQEIHNNSQSDPLSSSNEEFFQQMLSSITSPASAFPWADDQTPPLLCEQSAAKMRQHQISNGAAKAIMLQQQLLLAAANDLRSPTEPDAGFFPVPQGDRNDVVDGPSFNPAILENDASIKALFNGFSGSLGQTSNQPLHFHHQGESFGVSVAEASQPSAAGQSRQRVRARRGQATDPHSIAERLRRERIAERMKALQELVPNANRTDKASMLDEIIDYVKFLQLQVKVLSTSRLGGASAVAPLLGDTSSQKGNGEESKKGMRGAEEQQVAKLLEEDMGSAMQYLQGKGLCLMPISLATST